MSNRIRAGRARSTSDAPGNRQLGFRPRVTISAPGRFPAGAGDENFAVLRRPAGFGGRSRTRRTSRSASFAHRPSGPRSRGPWPATPSRPLAPMPSPRRTMREKASRTRKLAQRRGDQEPAVVRPEIERTVAAGPRTARPRPLPARRAGGVGLSRAGGCRSPPPSRRSRTKTPLRRRRRFRRPRREGRPSAPVDACCGGAEDSRSSPPATVSPSARPADMSGMSGPSPVDNGLGPVTKRDRQGRTDT